MLPSQKYNELMSRKRFSRDLTQEHAVLVLDGLYTQLFDRLKQQNEHFLKRLYRRFFLPESVIKGCYIWGGVGRGKTFIMDLFYDALPVKQKKRVHFHHFMKDIHERLGVIKHVKNPLQIIARQLSRDFTVLCLDEFMVQDIGDAMVLSELLAAMSASGIVLLTTSNTAPENLYLDGLQRAQFLKTISHINQHCHVLHVDSGIDYRTQKNNINTRYYTPHSARSLEDIKQWLNFHQYKLNAVDSINIHARDIATCYVAEPVIWFEFQVICKTNRSRTDYIALSKRFKVWVISGIQVMDDQTNDVTRRFITLIDVLYDNRNTLLISADVPIEQLYAGAFLKFEFKRTMSRLHEMQTKHYLSEN